MPENGSQGVGVQQDRFKLQALGWEFSSMLNSLSRIS
jgi:hypothetical protein